MSNLKNKRTNLSIIIPVYNAQGTVSRTLNSLQVIEKSHRKDVQVIIVNDGSTDQSVDQIQQTIRSIEGFDFELLHQKNQGVSAARNCGLQHAKGKWIFLLDADDVIVSNPIPYLSDAPHSAMTTCFVFPIDLLRQSKQAPNQSQKIVTLKPRSYTRKNLLDILTSGCPCSIPSIIFLKRLIQCPFSTQFSRLEDWLFWFENKNIFEHVKTINNTSLSRVYIHSNNASSNYCQWGLDRQRVAERLLKKYNPSLTRKQRNNLLLQIACGQSQAGKKIPAIQNFLRIPVSIVLYVKYIIYSTSALFNYKATPYK